MGKAHRYLLQSKETGGRWIVRERCPLRKKYHKKTTDSRVFLIEITSPTGECFPFDSFAPYDGTVPRPGALLLHFWDQLRRQDSTFVYEYGEGYHTELFWWNYLLIMQRPTRKNSFLENTCHIMPTFSCEFVLIARVQSLHGSRQLLAQDGRHWTNGWRDQSVLVNFICIYERLRHIYRI